MYSIYYPLLSQLFLVVPGPPLLPFLHSLVHLLSILFHHLQPTLQPEVTHAYHNGEWMPDNSLTEIQEAHFHTEFTVRQLVHRGQGSSFLHRIYCQATCSQRSWKLIFTQNLLSGNLFTEVKEAHFHTESTVRQLVHRGQGSSFSHRIYCQATCSQRSWKLIFTQNLLSGNLFTEVKEAHFHTESTVRQLVHRGQGSSFSHRIYCQATCLQRSRKLIFTQNLLSKPQKSAGNTAGHLTWTDFSDT